MSPSPNNITEEENYGQSSTIFAYFLKASEYLPVLDPLQAFVLSCKLSVKYHHTDCSVFTSALDENNRKLQKVADIYIQEKNISCGKDEE